MILSKPFGGNVLVNFDPVEGAASSADVESGKAHGNFHMLNDCCLAMYGDNGSLFLQAGDRKWNLSAGDVALNYFHNVVRKKTAFEVRFQGEVFQIEYDAWWADIPGFVPADPELDEHEDFLAYVYEVSKNSKLQSELIKAWE